MDGSVPYLWSFVTSMCSKLGEISEVGIKIEVLSARKGGVWYFKMRVIGLARGNGGIYKQKIKTVLRRNMSDTYTLPELGICLKT